MAWTWIRINGQMMLGFTYHDPAAGPSAKGALVHSDSLKDDVRRAIDRPDNTVRLGHGVYTPEPLAPEMIARFELPAEPEWMRFFLPSSQTPASSTSRPWRTDPALVGRFHPSFPDDLQVDFYFAASVGRERMWVQTDAVDGDIGGYAAVLLNQPHAPRAVIDKGARVSYRIAPGMPNPLWVSPAMQANMRDWSTKCAACGFDMPLEPIDNIVGPHVAAAHQRPHEILGMRCPSCGNEIEVKRRLRR
jgi:hypothetical protein